jgi:hypothetical protein
LEVQTVETRFKPDGQVKIYKEDIPRLVGDLMAMAMASPACWTVICAATEKGKYKQTNASLVITIIRKNLI